MYILMYIVMYLLCILLYSYVYSYIVMLLPRGTHYGTLSDKCPANFRVNKFPHRGNNKSLSRDVRQSHSQISWPSAFSQQPSAKERSRRTIPSAKTSL